MLRYRRFNVILIISFLIVSCTNKMMTVKEVMDKVVTQLYKSASAEDLKKLDNDKVIKLFSAEELKSLATNHWCFDANVQVVVSVMRSAKQKVIPFWLPESGFQKTDMILKNEQTIYEVWQKSYKAGRVGLGINGFDQELGMHYFVSVAPQNPNDQLTLSNFFPKNQFVGNLDNGAFTYHDWDELVLTDVPEEMKGQQLLTTTRGRTGESHLIGAFRESKFPSSATPDQIHLSWCADPSNSVDIHWRTDTTVSSCAIKYRIIGTSDEKIANGSWIRQDDRLLMNDRYINHFTAKLNDLHAGLTYEYVVGKKTDWSKCSSFSTAAADSSFSFLWFGDAHYSSKFGEILQLGVKNHPDIAFYSIVGDLVSDGLFRNQWDELFEYSRGVNENIPLMAVPGNHDNRAGLGAQLYREQFGFPENAPEGVPSEQTYSFTYKNALFLMIDATSPIDAQTTWIEKQLAESKATWKIAMFHFPPYNWEEPYLDIQKAWVPLFDKYHVDMVTGGHLHYYMRSKPMYGGKVVDSYNDGTAYVISVGIPSRNQEATDESYAAVRNFDGHLYQYVKIVGNKFSMITVNAENKIIDSFDIKK